MEKISLSIQITKPFSNLLRERHVLIACFTSDGKIVLGGKRNYPTGIYRLIGGGINMGEDPIDAAVREIEEELSVGVEKSKMEEIAEVTANVVDDTGKSYHLVTYIYKTLINENKIIPSDDISHVAIFNKEEYASLVDKYFNFDENFWQMKNGERTHTWKDYGQLYGPIHKIVLDNF